MEQEEKILNLIPVEYLCPYCGKWHNCGQYNPPRKLGYYNSPERAFKLKCDMIWSSNEKGVLKINFSDGYCYYQSSPPCVGRKLDSFIDGKISIKEIIRYSAEPYIKFTVHFRAERWVDCGVCNPLCLKNYFGDRYGTSIKMSESFGFLGYRI